MNSIHLVVFAFATGALGCRTGCPIAIGPKAVGYTKEIEQVACILTSYHQFREVTFVRKLSDQEMEIYSDANVFVFNSDKAGKWTLVGRGFTNN